MKTVRPGPVSSGVHFKTKKIMTVKIDNGNLVITLPISPRPSASGKTVVVASSNGNQPTTATHQGKPIIVGINAYVK